MTFTTFLARTFVLAAFASAAAISVPAAAPRKPPVDNAYQLAVEQYRAGRWSSAYGRFVFLANQGDPDAARISLFMHRYGPVLFNTYWDASTEEVQDWESIAGSRRTRAQPDYIPARSR